MTGRWQELEAIPQQMAAAVRPALKNVDHARYKRFLDAMVQYTRHSGARLRHAASHAPTPDLQSFFDRLAREESGHFRLAEADLDALDAPASDEEPPLVAHFHHHWMETTDPCWWLGALYVLENVGQHLQRDAIENLSRLGLSREQTRFVMVHLEADIDHGSSTATHVKSCFEQAPDRVLAAAKIASEFWVKLHLDALTESQVVEAAQVR